MMLLKRASLTFHTMRYLRPSQIFHRIRLRLLRKLIAAFPDLSTRTFRKRHSREAGWPTTFEPLDATLATGYPSMAENARGTFSFLNEARSLESPHDWRQTDAAQLWRYNLHYFEWAWAFLTEEPDSARAVFAELWRSWHATQRIGRGDAWSPYVVSLRAWVFCGVFDRLVRDQDFEVDFVDELAVHSGFVNALLERDVGGNHLIKNLKALIGLGCFFEDQSLLDRALPLLSEQLSVQILEDGGHYERSPSYHCQVLGDLVDIAGLLASRNPDIAAFLHTRIASMRSWLSSILMPDGDVPLFNDCTLVSLDRLKHLGVQSLRERAGLTMLRESGYFVARSGPFHLVGDIGPPCPDDLPAHAHADCLSFQLAVDGERVLVDTGTSTYQPGPRRDYERSTSAHNTIEIDGQDQTEIWGNFRAARRAQPTGISFDREGDLVIVRAGHDGYRRLKGAPVHIRTWKVSPKQVEVEDRIEGQGYHRVSGHLHVAPGIRAEVRDETVVTPTLAISFDGDQRSTVTSELRKTALGFGCEQDSTRIKIGQTSTLPIKMTMLMQARNRPEEGVSTS